jgi:TRAP-type mannitol/chloroaromatic compound transport system permease small subunit
VRVDIFFARYPDRTKIAMDIATSLISFVVSVIVVWLSYYYVLQSWNNGEGSANPGGIPYRYLLKAFIPIGFALFALQSLADAIKGWLRLNQAETAQ